MLLSGFQPRVHSLGHTQWSQELTNKYIREKKETKERETSNQYKNKHQRTKKTIIMFILVCIVCSFYINILQLKAKTQKTVGLSNYRYMGLRSVSDQWPKGIVASEQPPKNVNILHQWCHYLIIHCSFQIFSTSRKQKIFCLNQNHKVGKQKLKWFTTLSFKNKTSWEAQVHREKLFLLVKLHLSH